MGEVKSMHHVVPRDASYHSFRGVAKDNVKDLEGIHTVHCLAARLLGCASTRDKLTWYELRGLKVRASLV